MKWIGSTVWLKVPDFRTKNRLPESCSTPWSMPSGGRKTIQRLSGMLLTVILQQITKGSSNCILFFMPNVLSKPSISKSQLSEWLIIYILDYCSFPPLSCDAGDVNDRKLEEDHRAAGQANWPEGGTSNNDYNNEILFFWRCRRILLMPWSRKAVAVPAKGGRSGNIVESRSTRRGWYQILRSA